MNTRPPQFTRDLDLVRDILIWMERGAPRDDQPARDEPIRFAYHCQLMKEAELIDATIVSFPSDDHLLVDIPQRAVVRGLLWKGHEVLAAIRSDTIWQRTKAKLGELGLPMLMDLAIAVGKGIAAQHGVPLG